MAKLTYLPHPATDQDQSTFIRKTRTICIYNADRPGIYAKSLVRIVASCAVSGNRIEGVFCGNAVGSKKGCLIGHASHFKGFAEGTEIDVDILPATPDDCVEWLEGNEDPERKALSHILNVALEGAVNRHRNGTPYRLPKGTPASGCIGSAHVGPELSI